MYGKYNKIFDEIDKANKHYHITELLEDDYIRLIMLYTIRRLFYNKNNESLLIIYENHQSQKLFLSGTNWIMQDLYRIKPVNRTTRYIEYNIKSFSKNIYCVVQPNRGNLTKQLLSTDNLSFDFIYIDEAIKNEKSKMIRDLVTPNLYCDRGILVTATKNIIS